MGLLGDRAGTRMGARQQYRTFSRMQRRRSYAEDKTGARQDFQPAGEGDQQQAPAQQAPAEPKQPAYMAELKELAQLRDQGVITAGDFEAKKKQLLGI
jgi:hypothetical protein